MTEPTQPQTHLEQVSTRWSTINDPVQFMLRYAVAVRTYFGALLPEPYDAEDAFQKFCLRVVEKGFVRANPDQGRFRDYLKKAVRNFAINYRRDQPPPRSSNDLDQCAAASDTLESRFLAEWQRCVLNRAWRALEIHEQEHKDNLAYTVLRLAADHADESSHQLATRLSQSTGRTYRADAFRKQLSRSRRLFAALLRTEVAHTLDDPTADDVDAELMETGLMPYLRDLLAE